MIHNASGKLAPFLLAVSLVTGISCASPENHPLPESATAISEQASTRGLDELNGTGWALHSIYGKGLVAASYVSLYFLDGYVRGYSGCNTYGGEYAVESADKLKFSNGVLTLLGGPADVIAQEQSYAAVLMTVESYHITGEELVLDGQGSLVFTKLPEYAADPAKLVNTTWRLVSIGGMAVNESLDATLGFDDSGSANGTSGPFSYTLQYEARGDDIWWTSQLVKRTTMAISPTDDEAGRFTGALGFAASYRIVNGQLEIFAMTGDRDTLVLEAVN